MLLGFARKSEEKKKRAAKRFLRSIGSNIKKTFASSLAWHSAGVLAAGERDLASVLRCHEAHLRDPSGTEAVPAASASGLSRSIANSE